jgi:PAS domain S-box-containing protein
MVMAPTDILSDAFRKATLQSERSRILGLLLVLAAVLAVVVTRDLTTGVPEQRALLPWFLALGFVSAAYEGLMLAWVRRAIRRGGDLSPGAWSLTIGVETLIPTAAILLLTESAFLGPYRALSAPAAHAYYFLIILSALRLRPVLCVLTGLASAVAFAVLTAYTLLVYPAGPGGDDRALPLQIYVTYGLFFVISSAVAAGLSARLRRHILAALREAETRRRFEQLEREIAERERAEAALRTSERRYRQLTEGTRDAIVVADPQGLITLFNPAAQHVFGYSEPEAIGQPLTMLTPPDDRDTHREGLNPYLSAPDDRLSQHPVELRGRRKSGEVFPMELSLTALELPEGIVVLAAVRDVSERHRLQARLVQSERLASLGVLSAGVAHEINNPLAYVSNNLALLERDIGSLKAAALACEEAQAILESTRPDLAAKVARLVEEIGLPYVQQNIERILGSTRQGVKRVADIVQNLRDFARLDRAELDCVNLHDAITCSLEMLQERLSRCAIVVERQWGDLPLVSCAPAQINQVFLNVLVNAVQAIEATARGHGRIEIRTRTAGGAVVVDLADDGCGIPAELLPRIFDPFFTTKPVGAGTGLGLSISHGIVAEHGGRIEVDSTPGQGTRFRVILPVDDKGAGEAGGIGTAAQAVSDR